MKVDQFESVFRSADKEPFRYERIEFGRVLVISDLSGDPANVYMDDARRLLNVLGDGPNWSAIGGPEYTGIQSLLDKVREAKPDLIVTYRCLQTGAWKWPYTLGRHLDVLTQILDCPVLVTPHPDSGRASSHAMQNTDSIMVVTNHLTGDHRLVNVAARLTQPDGILFLAHIEDDAGFDRYIEIIGKIDSIDTEDARETIRRQLLKEPADYVESCRESLTAHKLTLKIESYVGMGHQLDEYRRLIGEHEVDLLVMNTKDEDQLAMHGLAYPLAVELREIPLLLL